VCAHDLCLHRNIACSFKHALTHLLPLTSFLLCKLDTQEYAARQEGLLKLTQNEHVSRRLEAQSLSNSITETEGKTATTSTKQQPKPGKKTLFRKATDSTSTLFKEVTDPMSTTKQPQAAQAFTISTSKEASACMSQENPIIQASLAPAAMFSTRKAPKPVGGMMGGMGDLRGFSSMFLPAANGNAGDQA
jgi:hypothetical protein